jgi:hypothetical protein
LQPINHSSPSRRVGSCRLIEGFGAWGQNVARAVQRDLYAEPYPHQLSE